MKVMCIKETEYNHITLVKQASPVKCGKIYHVLYEHKEFGILYYALQEFGKDIGFQAKAFIPLSNIDENKFERDYTKQAI